MEIVLNGKREEWPDGMTVAALIASLGMQPRFLAVERNRQLVPRREHATCVLTAGDEIEIVTLVGGG